MQNVIEISSIASEIKCSDFQRDYTAFLIAFASWNLFIARTRRCRNQRHIQAHFHACRQWKLLVSDEIIGVVWTLGKSQHLPSLVTATHIVTWHLKGGIVEPEDMALARQRLDKHLSETTDTHATIEDLLEAVVPLRSVPRLYSEGHQERLSCHRSCEAVASQ
jgi:hypothetical protein